MKFKRAIIYPYTNPENEYTNIQISLFNACKLETHKFSIYKLMTLAYKSDDIIILNWFENCVLTENGYPNILGIFKFLLFLIFSKLNRCKIIWVKHNKAIHSARSINRIFSKMAMYLLQKASDITVTHSSSYAEKKSLTYIPHPLYNNPTIKTKEFGDPLKFLTFGSIRKNKKIEDLIEIWPNEIDLTIAGKSTKKYEKEILDKIRKSGKKINVLNHHYTNTEVNEILSENDVLVISNPSNTSIISGVYYLGKSFGNIIIKKDNFDMDFCSLTYSDEQGLKKAIMDAKFLAKSIKKDEILYDANKKYSFDVCKSSWITLLNKI